MGGSNSAQLSDLSSDESDESLTPDARSNAVPTINNADNHNRCQLKLEELVSIEDDLEDYEMISMVYLLYDNPSVALRAMEALLSGSSEKLLYNWAHSEHDNNRRWEDKLIEAFTIIQNYAVLKKYGFTKDKLSNYLPHQPLTSIFINRTRKAMYCICEKLTIELSENLIKYVKRDFENSTEQFIYKDYILEYMEMYFLYWETIGYITANDLFNIKSFFKITPNCDAFYTIIDDISPCVPPAVPMQQKKQRKQSNSNDCQNQNNENDVSLSFSSLGVKDSVVPTSSIQGENKNNIYPIDADNPGVCLIISQEYFYHEPDPQYQQDLIDNKIGQLKDRKGTKQDEKLIVETFTQYNYRVIVARDLTNYQMIDKINETVSNIRHESSLIIFILSHGEEGVVFGSNSCKVKVKDIQEIMYKRNKEHLLYKPKILILQSCQGYVCQKLTDSDEEDVQIQTDSGSNKYRIPAFTNICIYWATVPGYAAVRNKTTGSWFIQTLCKNLKEHSDREHFLDICTITNDEVTNLSFRYKENDERSMAPDVHHNFTKKFYLPKLKQQ